MSVLPRQPESEPLSLESLIDTERSVESRVPCACCGAAVTLVEQGVCTCAYCCTQRLVGTTHDIATFLPFARTTDQALVEMKRWLRLSGHRATSVARVVPVLIPYWRTERHVLVWRAERPDDLTERSFEAAVHRSVDFEPAIGPCKALGKDLPFDDTSMTAFPLDRSLIADGTLIAKVTSDPSAFPAVVAVEGAGAGAGPESPAEELVTDHLPSGFVPDDEEEEAGSDVGDTGDDASEDAGKDTGAAGVGDDDAGDATGGDAGDATGGDAGDATDGDAGDATDGDAGDATDGDAGDATDGDAGDATDGDAGDATGGDAGDATDGDADDATDGDAGDDPGPVRTPVIEPVTGEAPAGPAASPAEDAVSAGAGFAYTSEIRRSVARLYVPFYTLRYTFEGRHHTVVACGRSGRVTGIVDGELEDAHPLEAREVLFGGVTMPAMRPLDCPSCAGRLAASGAVLTCRSCNSTFRNERGELVLTACEIAGGEGVRLPFWRFVQSGRARSRAPSLHADLIDDAESPLAPRHVWVPAFAPCPPVLARKLSVLMSESQPAYECRPGSARREAHGAARTSAGAARAIAEVVVRELDGRLDAGGGSAPRALDGVEPMLIWVPFERGHGFLTDAVSGVRVADALLDGLEGERAGTR